MRLLTGLVLRPVRLKDKMTGRPAQRRANKKWSEKRLNVGLCLGCGKPNDSASKWHCSACLEKRRKSAKLSKNKN